MGEEALPSPCPGRCIYGYALFILSNFILLLYAVSLIPDVILNYLGLTYLPSKYWYIAIPTIISIIIVTFGFIIYPSIVLTLTEPMDSVSLFKDDYSNSKTEIWDGNGDSIELDIPPIYDITTEEATKMVYYHPELLSYQ